MDETGYESFGREEVGARSAMEERERERGQMRKWEIEEDREIKKRWEFIKRWLLLVELGGQIKKETLVRLPQRRRKRSRSPSSSCHDVLGQQLNASGANFPFSFFFFFVWDIKG